MVLRLSLKKAETSALVPVSAKLFGFVFSLEPSDWSTRFVKVISLTWPELRKTNSTVQTWIQQSVCRLCTEVP